MNPADDYRHNQDRRQHPARKLRARSRRNQGASQAVRPRKEQANRKRRKRNGRVQRHVGEAEGTVQLWYVVDVTDHGRQPEHPHGQRSSLLRPERGPRLGIGKRQG